MEANEGTRGQELGVSEEDGLILLIPDSCPLIPVP